MTEGDVGTGRPKPPPEAWSFGMRPTISGRAPAFRYLPPQHVLELERVRAKNVGHGPNAHAAIQRLFAAETKKDAEKLAAVLVLGGQDLFDLVENCGAIRYAHVEGNRHDLPEGRALTPKESVGLLYSRGDPDPRVLRKVRDGYREQKHLSWHLFTHTGDASRWHCIFYEHRDVMGDPLTGEHHSKVGPHVHYSSYLFHAMSSAEFVKMMAPGARVPHDVHIRFRSSFTELDWADVPELIDG